MAELEPAAVLERLAEAARLYRPVQVDEHRETPPAPDLTPEAVGARLQELRELLRLVAYLSSATR